MFKENKEIKLILLYSFIAIAILLTSLIVLVRKTKNKSDTIENIYDYIYYDVINETDVGKSKFDGLNYYYFDYSSEKRLNKKRYVLEYTSYQLGLKIDDANIHAFISFPENKKSKRDMIYEGNHLISDLIIQFTTDDDYKISIFLQGVYDVKNKTMSKSFYLVNHNNQDLSWEVYTSFEEANTILTENGFTKEQLKEIINWYVDEKIPSDWINNYPDIGFDLGNLGRFQILPYNTYNQTPNPSYYNITLGDYF